MVDVVPRGATFERERLTEFGIDQTVLEAGSGIFAYSCVVVDVLPPEEEQLDGVLYFVREVGP